MENVMAMKLNGKLNEAQLDIVVGGVSPEAILDGVKKAIAIGASGAEAIQTLVDSHSYRRMSNLQREKAIGKILANNPVFCGVMLAQTTAIGLTALQVKFRTVGVSKTTREYIEKEIACR